MLKGSLPTASSAVAASMLALAHTLLIARWLGASGQGEFVTYLAAPLIASSVIGAGLTTALPRFAGLGHNVFGIYRTVMGLAARNLAIGVPLTVVCTYIYLQQVQSVGTTLWVALGVSLLVPFQLLHRVQLAVLQGMARFRLRSQLVVAASGLRLLSGVLVVGAVRLPIAAAYSVVAAEVVSAALGWLVVRRCARRAKGSVAAERLSTGTDVRRFSRASAAADIAAVLNFRLDILLAGLLTSPAQVGLYSVAAQAAERLWFISQSLSTVLLPRLSALVGEGRDIRPATWRIARLSTALTGLVGLGSLLVARDVFRMLLGQEFAAAFDPYAVLLVGITAVAASRIVSAAINAHGEPTINAKIGSFGVVLNALLNLVLIPIFGAVGAAGATSISYSTVLLIRSRVFQTRNWFEESAES